MPSFDPGVLERLDKLKGEWDALHDVISVQLNLFHHYKQNSSRKLPELPAELIGDGGNPECDVMAAELQFESIKASLPQFELIVVAMQECILKYKLKVAELGMDQAVDRGQFGCALSRVDYLMMAANVCAMFENEYVFKERVISNLSFDSPDEELSTQLLAWSSKPYLDKSVFEVIHQRQNFSNSVELAAQSR